MKQNKIIITLLIVLIASVVVGILILNGKGKKSKGLPPPDGMGIYDTITAKAMWVDSLSDVVHYNDRAFIIRKGVVDIKTKQFLKPPELKLLDENKKPIPRVKNIL